MRKKKQETNYLIEFYDAIKLQKRQKGYTVECRCCKAKIEGLRTKKVALAARREHLKHCCADLFLESVTNVVIRDAFGNLSMAGTGKGAID